MYNIMQTPPPLPLWDITARKHGGNEQSREAHQKVARLAFSDRQKVLREIHSAGRNGATVKDVAAAMCVGLNQISGRFSELKAAGLISKIGVRDGCGVYVDIGGTHAE
jgi:hypothetical protein